MSAIDYEKESASRSNWLDITGGTEVTLLDEFAGKAMQSLVAKVPLEFSDADEENPMYAIVARGAYEYAEAMLAERTKRFTQPNVVRGVTGKTYG